MVKPTTIHLILALEISFGRSLRQLNVNNSFLHGYLTENVFMVQPPDFSDQQHPSHVCKLRKALLQYLSLSRLDITFSVNKLSQFMHHPTSTH